MCVDWSNIDKVQYLSAMERCPINTLEISTLINSNLKKNINDREVYFKGIDNSYYYEKDDL